MSLWDLDPDHFAQTDWLLEQYERREERAKLHGYPSSCSSVAVEPASYKGKVVGSRPTRTTKK